MHSTPETRAIAQAIADWIDEHPDNHDQAHWVWIDSLDDESVDDEQLDNVDVCDTTMCVAGSAAYQKYGMEIFSVKWQSEHIFAAEGAELLGLNGDEAHHLFYDVTNPVARDIVAGLSIGEWRGESWD